MYVTCCNEIFYFNNRQSCTCQTAVFHCKIEIRPFIG